MVPPPLLLLLLLLMPQPQGLLVPQQEELRSQQGIGAEASNLPSNLPLPPRETRSNNRTFRRR